MRGRQSLRVWCSIYFNLHAIRLIRSASVTVTHGDRAVLPCDHPRFEDSSRLHIVWTLTPWAENAETFQILLYQGGNVINMHWNLGSRVAFIGDPAVNGSISIEKIQRSDGGVYQCLVVNPLQNDQSIIRLVNLSVLEKPSTPTCSTDGGPHLGESVSLICSSTNGNPNPQYSWWKIESSGNVPLSLLQNQGSVLIHNVSLETSGLYVCISSNSIGSSSCSILLKLEIFEQHENTLAAAVTVALAMALILLILFGLVLCLHWENRRQQWRAAQENQEASVPIDLDEAPIQLADPRSAVGRQR
ncbi:immunoglobulin superfamily member 11-like isoform X2 [Scyliorhinus torazame]|uniref:immunoglobulin superfamily member 11-like isoform X2 n=1 Tax=Scyliorhinus torazame TaxID=75743 RepID=UPI003B5B15EC